MEVYGVLTNIVKEPCVSKLGSDVKVFFLFIQVNVDCVCVLEAQSVADNSLLASESH